MQFVVEIKNHNGHYHGTLHQGNPAFGRALSGLQLHADAQIIIKGEECKLGELVQTLIDHQADELTFAFDERGQLEIGRHLYRQIFAADNEAKSDLRANVFEKAKPPFAQAGLYPPEAIDLRIITDDEHLARLPWVLLADKGIFLTTAGWTITLSTKTATRDCELPPSPRMLIIAPQPHGVAPTRAQTHFEKLESHFSAQDHRLALGKNLKLAHTWEEFTQLAKEFEPHIVYYYGHGTGDQDNGRLVFATGTSRQRVDKPIADFALCLQQMATPPLLAYVNCCLGDAAGALGAGMQLGDFIPAVVTNRTKARIEAAQAQAFAFWDGVLFKGLAPHRAVANLYVQLGDLNLSLEDARWMNPVVHGHYEQWRANPPRPVNRLEHDPYWHVKLDRVEQKDIVTGEIRQMLREQKPRSLAFVWYGQKGQGVEVFHERLKVELREDLREVFIEEVRPVWPMDLHNCHRSFSDMLTEVFQVNSLHDIAASLRAKTQGAFGKQTLVYVRHEPVTSNRHLINPKTYKDYLEWWDSQFVPLLEKQQFVLLGVSFVVENPANFETAMEEKVRINDLVLHDTVFRLLNALKKVARKDLLDFLQTHSIRLPLLRRDKILTKILEETGGHYEMTIAALKDLVQRAWDLTEEEKPDEQPPAAEFDY